MNLLDLREKVQPQIKVVEKVVFKKVPWYLEALKITLGIAITTTVVWGVSNADVASLVESLRDTKSEVPVIKNFSASGIVTGIQASTLSLTQADTSTEQNDISITVDISKVKKIESNHYEPLTISDIKLGDQVVVQGLMKNSDISISRIISFSYTKATSTDTATSTATSTESTSTSTEQVSSSSTSDISSSTPDTSTTTPDTSTSTEQTATTTLTETISNIIDATTSILTGSSTDTNNNPPQTEPTPEPAPQEPAPETPPSDSNPAP
ncbi:hypothetical protein IT397_02525 [Candidatus Nomurabacteria bacterium]|nr:hypothetical protein [Candidatus Nomurabacteria bacterium]